MGAVPAPAQTNFGKYSLVAKLATGGMAEIFLARLSGVAGFEKLVCIKRILPHLAKDQNLVGMFLAEAKIAAAISHHNVCQVFELGEIDGRYFIAMEYLEGVPFSCFRRRDMYPPPPDPRVVAGLGVQACEGLHHAHQLKRPDGSLLEVVHRDVSSNNLFVTVDGIVKVLDFGIAKVQDASIRTSTGSVKGTYAYMAPEQLRGEQLDRRTDVFAVGIVLWEMFARRHLFKRETDFLTFQAITQDPIPDVCEFRPDVPPELADVIATALSRKREERFPSARALGEALTRSVASLGGPCTPSELSELIAEAFQDRLKDQHELIRIAREGGALDLTDDLGPGVGHGTAMMTTPVSAMSNPNDLLEKFPLPSAPAPLPRRTSKPMAAVTPRRDPTPIPGGPRSRTMDVVPLPVAPASRSKLLPILLAVVLLLGLGFAAFYLFVLNHQEKPNAQAGSGSTITVAASQPDASQAPSYNPRPDADAGTVAPPVDAAPVAVDAAAEVVDAAAAPADATSQHTPVPIKKDPPKPPVVVSGPPGFITIDSTPVYAVIYIDGRSYGETPLPRVQLSPGRHTVRAVSASGTAQSAVVVIESGKVAPKYRFRW